ncbi:amino acid adenylation domain-containing protein, partial [Paraburkholderia jirisanensis]
EALPYALQQRCMQALPHTGLHNLYGPTEAAVDVTSWVCSDTLHPGIVPIGKPVANTRMYILDAHLQPVPLGVAGELYIGGVQVARGYLNRPELTAERFIADPFSDDADARLYKTGDLARFLADGNIEYLGRNDFQVKIRGLRIELGEIEAKLAACEGVREAVVIAREDTPGDKRLVAYLAADDIESVTAAALRVQLATQLPEYMVPSAFVVLTELPLSPNGKLDRRALPAPDASSVITRDYEAPQGDIETALAAIWQQLLGLERVGRNDHFFELGGHSLLVISLIEQLRQHGLHAHVQTVFTSPTLAAMAASVERGEACAFVVPANRIPAGCSAITPDMLPLVTLTQAEIARIVAEVPAGVADIQDIYPLAPLQEGILFHHLLGTEGDAYLMRTVLSFDARERLERFLGALQTVIDRHDILRSSVHWSGLPQAVQVVHREAKLPVQTVTLDATGDALQQLLDATDPRTLRLDLQRAPLLRVYQAADPHSDAWFLSLVDHHMISDNVTLELILAEIETVLQGRGDTLPPSLPYRNFIARTRAIAPADHEAYFRTQLADIDEPTAPFGILNVKTDDEQIDIAVLPLVPSLGQRIRECARQRGVTPAVLFHAAWAQVLARCTGRDDVVFGTVLSGRLQGSEGADKVFGMFINTLPVRISVAQCSAAELVSQTYQRLGGLLAHEQTSLSLAQRCSAVPASMPLFTALLNYRLSNVADRDTAERLTSQGMHVLASETRTNYALDVGVDDLGNSFSLRAQCVPGIDPQRVAAYLATAMESLVDALQGNDAQPASALEILPAHEQYQLLDEFNATAADWPHDQLIHQLFEARVDAQPEAVAIVYENDALTYGELNRRANRLAHQLIALGVKPDQRVAICAERSVDMVVGLLGILKAGGAYVPLDPAYPEERLAYMLSDSAPVALVTQQALRDTLPAAGVPTLLLDGTPDGTQDGVQDAASSDAPFQHNPDAAALGITSSNLAYVIYTSGSTGRSKGVMVEHKSVVNFWRVLGQTTHRYCPAYSSVAVNAAFSFDMSIKGLSQLLSGHRVVLIPQAVRASGTELLDFLEKHRVDAFDSTPSQLEGLLAAGLLERANYQPVSVLLGGEAINATTWDKLRQSGTTRFYNMYGPTEATVDATIGLIPELGERPSIGWPIANAQVYVLDAQMRPAPINVAGELYIGGAGVARGYLDRPELTAERFVPDPFSTTPGARLYKTGDLGRYIANGTLEYLGRNDFQVKIRGFRIELGEIEALLTRCEGVREAVVIAREDQPGNQRLVAYLTAHEGYELSVARLRNRLGAALAEYMVPAAFVVLAELPLNPNGKVDRRALPAPDSSALVTRAYVAPQGSIEVAVAEIWQDLLDLEQVGRYDHFLELGGHSLLAVQLLSRLRKMLGVRIALRDFFAQPTVESLARIVTCATRAPLPALVKAERSEVLPTSYAQQRLWFLNELDHAAGAAYHMPAALRLQGELQRDALRATLDRVVARHEILRTSFAVHDDYPVQRIAPPDTGFALVETDLRALDPLAQHNEVERISQLEASAPFDLANGPLIRGQLLQLGEADHILLVTQHHIISDGWSIGLLVDEVSTLYAAFCQQQPDPLPALPVQYADYAAWQRQWLQGDVLKQQLEFWKSHLHGAPALLDLPADRARPAVQSYAGDSVPFALSPQLSDALRQLSQQHGTTLFMTLLAGWAVTLGSFSGQHDIVVGTPVANRQHPDLEKLLGFFVNTLAIRVRFTENSSIEQLLAQVRETALAAYAHQDLPFEQVVEALQPVRSLSHSPIFQVMLSMNNTPDVELSLPGLALSSVPQAQTTNQFDLSLSMIDDGSAVAGALIFAADLFDAATVEAIGARFCDVLTAFTADPQQRVADLGARLPARLPKPAQAVTHLAAGAAGAAGAVAAAATPQVEAEAVQLPYEAPQGRIESAVAQIWQQLLKRDSISRHDDFFELGGISLMAVQMVSKLRPLGIQASLRDLFTNPTLKAFAASLDRESAAKHHPNLVPIRTGGSATPLFLVHPVGGEVQYARSVAAVLDLDIPVYGLAARGFANGETPLRTVEAMADVYLDAIRQVQNKGPYRIAGWSAGGLIAYEIARRLLAAHQRVEFVGLLDASCPAPRDDGVSTFSEMEYLRYWLPQTLPESLAQQFAAFGESGDTRAALAFCKAHGLLPKEIAHDIEVDMLHRHLAVAHGIQEALLAYRPAPLVAAPVTLLAASAVERADRTLGWGALLGERLQVVPVDGTHLTMVEAPQVDSLGKALSFALAPKAVAA